MDLVLVAAPALGSHAGWGWGAHECKHAVPCEPMDAGAVCACGKTFSKAQKSYFVCRHKEGGEVGEGAEARAGRCSW